MTQPAVTIQITPTSRPSTPSWLGEVAVFAQVLGHLGLLKAIQEHARFTRARFAHGLRNELKDVLMCGRWRGGKPAFERDVF